LARVARIVQTPTFRKKVKKLKANQKKDLDKAVAALMDDPALGEQKRGDLAYLRVYKFKMAKQLTLLGYSYDNGNLVLELLALGSYENFYRDVKNSFGN
jgi:mRNA-degrading endonuclease RelE of RelBE toxin-antitoxin system